MALMARTLGIPARVVGGYLGGERAAFGGWHLVRQRNAHAWVEAWTGTEWRTYDPTPPDDVAAAQRSDADWLASLWHVLVAELGAWWDAVTADELLRLALYLGIFLALFLLIPRWWRERRARRRMAAEGADGPLPCFAAFETACAGVGLPRGSGESLAAYADRLEAQGIPEGAVVRAYAALRYGGVGEEAAVVGRVERAAATLRSAGSPPSSRRS